MVAVFACWAGLVTDARIRRGCGVPTATVPAIHTPVAGLYVPWLDVAETIVRPTGRTSVTTTLVASPGPRSSSPIVYVIVPPTLGAASSTALVKTTSACCGEI